MNNSWINQEIILHLFTFQTPIIYYFQLSKNVSKSSSSPKFSIKYIGLYSFFILGSLTFSHNHFLNCFLNCKQ